MSYKILNFIFQISCLVYVANCLTLQQAKSNPLLAYVLTSPNGSVVGNSGVRVGPLDLKYENPDRLQKYGTSQDLIQKFLPYLGKSGQQALDLIQQKPLSITQQEYDTLSTNVINFWKPKLDRAPASLKQNPTAQQLAALAMQRDWPVFWSIASVFIDKYLQPTGQTV